MLRCCLLILIVAMDWRTGLAQAGKYFSVIGKVLDSSSNQPLPYANISLAHSSHGTISNESGDFEFSIPINAKEDSLQVSYLGYQTYKEKIVNIHSSLIISLVESPTLLNELVVSGDGAKKMVIDALNAIPVNYPVTPYLMEGFHRSWEKLDFTDSISYPGTLIEAAVTIYDPGYKFQTSKSSGKVNEEVFINELKRTAVQDGWEYGRNFLRDLLEANPVRHTSSKAFMSLDNLLSFPNTLVYEWEGSIQLDGESLSIIKVEIPNKKKFPASYKVYISDTDRAILRIELTGYKKEVDFTLGEWHTERLQETYIFKRYENKVFLRYAKRTYTIKKLDTIKKKVLSTEDYSRELLINRIITDGDIETTRKKLTAKKVKSVSLALQKIPYNEIFWKSYNVILENPLDKEVIDYFNKKSLKK